MDKAEKSGCGQWPLCMGDWWPREGPNCPSRSHTAAAKLLCTTSGRSLRFHDCICSPRRQSLPCVGCHSSSKPHKPPTGNQWLGFQHTVFISGESSGNKLLRFWGNHIVYSILLTKEGDRAATLMCHIIKPTTHLCLKEVVKINEHTMVVTRQSGKIPCISKTVATI